jgi:DNA polymerase III psi subunit
MLPVPNSMDLLIISQITPQVLLPLKTFVLKEHSLEDSQVMLLIVMAIMECKYLTTTQEFILVNPLLIGI